MENIVDILGKKQKEFRQNGVSYLTTDEVCVLNDVNRLRLFKVGYPPTPAFLNFKGSFLQAIQEGEEDLYFVLALLTEQNKVLASNVYKCIPVIADKC